MEVFWMPLCRQGRSWGFEGAGRLRGGILEQLWMSLCRQGRFWGLEGAGGPRGGVLDAFEQPGQILGVGGCWELLPVALCLSLSPPGWDPMGWSLTAVPHSLLLSAGKRG